MTGAIRVLCVDDHALLLEGLCSIINRHPDLSVIATASDGEQAIRLFRKHRPDVTLMDLRLPGVSGLEAIRTITTDDPSARVIVLTTYQSDEEIYGALAAGALTYLLKDTLSDCLVQTIRAAHRGEVVIDNTIRTRLADRASRPALTGRELEVTRLVAKGLRNKEIASILGISTETVQSHVKNILSKLGVTDRTAAVHVALRRGIVQVDE
jgi:two-component system NarL family response regulator